MYEELIKRLRNVSIELGQVDHVSVLLLEAADAIEELNREAEEYKTAYREEHNKRIAENKYLYDELTKAVRAKLLMTPIRIEMTEPPKEEN